MIITHAFLFLLISIMKFEIDYIIDYVNWLFFN